MAIDPRYADFLGEGGTTTPQNAPTSRYRATTPDGLRYLDDGTLTPQGKVEEDKRHTATRTINMNSGRLNAARPSLYGLSLDPATAQESADYIRQAEDARDARDGGLWGDLARLGTYAYTGGPAADIIRQHTPKPLGDLLTLPQNITDELADQIIPGGSGNQAGNIIPFVDRTGDQFYPSETIQGGSYKDGYRGVTNSGNTGLISGAIDGVPGWQAGEAIGGFFKDLFSGPDSGGGSRGGSGEGGAGGGAAPGSNKPPSYRTDQVDQDIRRFLAEERNNSGPSEAEALMAKATDRIAAQSLGIAAGARGGAAARERATRGAQSANVAMAAEASSNLAALRAREANEAKARQSAILSMLSGNASAGDARDLGYYESDNSRITSENIAEANRALERDKFNASQKPGFLDDPLGNIFGALTGRELRSGQKI
jgi:hypothetical protein